MWEKYALRRRGNEVRENNVFDPEKKVVEIKLKHDELPSHPAKYGLLLRNELIHRGFCKWHSQGSNPKYTNAGFTDAVYDMRNAIQPTISRYESDCPMDALIAESLKRKGLQHRLDLQYI